MAPRLGICSVALAFLLAISLPVICSGTPAPPVKKSKAGICHDTSSPSYERTRTFVPYGTMEDCIASGGRYPKGTLAVATKHRHSDASWSSTLRDVKDFLRGAISWLADRPWMLVAISFGGIILHRAIRRHIQRRRVRKRDRLIAEREREQWSAHRRESPLSVS